MNSSMQNVGFQLPASHLAAFAQPHPHLPVSSTPFASLQNLQKSAALQQLALHSTLSNLYRQQQAAQLPNFQQPSNVATAAAAAALLAASQMAQLQSAQSAPSLHQHQFLHPPPSQSPLVHAQGRLDNATLELAHLQALAAAAVAGQAASSSASHDVILQAAAAAAAAASATANSFNNTPPNPPSPLDASPLMMASPTANNNMWAHAPATNTHQNLDPQVVTALLSSLLNPKPEPSAQAPQNPLSHTFNPSYLPQATNLLAHSLSLPASLSLQDVLAAQAQKQEEATWQVPQRATWHAQAAGLSSSQSGPTAVQRNSLDIRPVGNMPGQPLHLHHAGITHAGSRSPPAMRTKKPSPEPLSTTPPTAGKVALLDAQAASNPAVQNLAKLINQAGIVAGRKKSTQEDGDSAGKDEFKQRILVQVGEKLARAGFTVEQAVKAGLLGGMYVGEVKVLCTAHEAEVKRIKQEKADGIPPPVDIDLEDIIAIAQLSPKSLLSSNSMSNTPFAAGGSPLSSPTAALADATKSGPLPASALQRPSGVAIAANRVQSAPAMGNNFDAFAYGFFGTDSDESLIGELEYGDSLNKLSSLGSDGVGMNIPASLKSSGSLDSSNGQSSGQSNVQTGAPPSGTALDGRAHSLDAGTAENVQLAVSPDNRFTLFVANDEEVKPFGKSSWQTTQADGKSPGLWRKGGAAVQMHAAAKHFAELQQ